ncbi:hypothetical protein EON65_43480 [archaeon]|nr:MAG: hypothetical protein EON65_43480 [archaeon]
MKLFLLFIFVVIVQVSSAMKLPAIIVASKFGSDHSSTGKISIMNAPGGFPPNPSYLVYGQ